VTSIGDNRTGAAARQVEVRGDYCMKMSIRGIRHECLTARDNAIEAASAHSVHAPVLPDGIRGCDTVKRTIRSPSPKYFSAESGLLNQ
jgi:hypothetical protein